jgi:hypothetical protein
MGDRPESMSGTVRGDQDEDITTGEIKADIQQTRVDLSETIDAIQERLRPGNLLAQAGETVRDATVGKVKQMATNVGEKASEVASQTRDAAGSLIDRILDSGLAQRIRENPVPAVVAGIGLAWLAVTNGAAAPKRGPRRKYSGADRSSGGGGGYDYAVGTVGQDREPRSDDWRDEREWSREAAAGVRRTSRRAAGQFQRAIRMNPLAASAIAAGVGAVIGFALPETERENEWMGQSRDAVVDRAQDMALDAAERVKDAAGSVKGAADQAIDSIARGE